MNADRRPNARSARRWIASIVPALLALVMAVLVMSTGAAQTPGFKLDCAVEWNNGKYYFFRGSQYISFDIEKNHADPGYPQPIAKYWPQLARSGWTSDLDAAVKWTDEIAYFFKGDKVIIYNMKKDEATTPLPFAIVSPFLQGKFNKIDTLARLSDEYALVISEGRGALLNVKTLMLSEVFDDAPRQLGGVPFKLIDASLKKGDEVTHFSGSSYARRNYVKQGQSFPSAFSLNDWPGISEEYWSAKTAYTEKNREFSTTFENPRETRRADPTDFTDGYQGFRPVTVPVQTRQAYKARPTHFRFELTPIVVRRANDVVVRLTDSSEFNNACYAKQDHWAGYFLDSINITYRNLTPEGWTSPKFGPKGANKAGGYGHESGFNVSAGLGFSGGPPEGSVSAGWSTNSSTSAEVADLEFSSNAPDGTPTFKWWTTQMYDGLDKPIVVNGDWWNGIRKSAAQVDATRSVYDAPKIVQASFEPLSYVYYTVKTGKTPEETAAEFTRAASRDMHLLVEYEVSYRALHTRNLVKNEGDGFLRGFSLVFGANPGMYTGEAFRSWATSVIRHKYAVEVIIPKEHLQKLIDPEVETVVLRNRWTNKALVRSAAGGVEQGDPAANAANAKWLKVPVPGVPGHFRLKAVNDPDLLLLCDGTKLDVGKDDTTRSEWQITEAGDAPGYLRIRNVGRKELTYLHTERGKLEASEINLGWWSAHWKLEKP